MLFFGSALIAAAPDSGDFFRNRNRQDPSNHLKDLALNSRVDVNRFLSAKLQPHYMDGRSFGFTAVTNPHGLDEATHLLLPRVGFYFDERGHGAS